MREGNLHGKPLCGEDLERAVRELDETARRLDASWTAGELTIPAPPAPRALTVAMADHDGPCYMRTLRPDVPPLYDADARFELGGHRVVERGQDLLLVAAGSMIHEARRALAGLRERGVGATLVDPSRPTTCLASLSLAAPDIVRAGMELAKEDQR